MGEFARQAHHNHQKTKSALKGFIVQFKAPTPSCNTELQLQIKPADAENRWPDMARAGRLKMIAIKITLVYWAAFLAVNLS
ncbi:MAG: hypothetical protein LBT47_05250 [Deltaproteobacteria bacterium]|nr:hypothetical protein [Deltaproteobacteria bacterium]